MSLANQFDLACDQIVGRVELRLQCGDQTKLSRGERDHLAESDVRLLGGFNRLILFYNSVP
jgi:hypothetical protein